MNLPAWKRKKQTEQKQGVHAFIDSQNLNLGVQRAGWKMDWKQFRTFLKETYGVTKAYMFIGYMPEYEDLYVQMHEAGFMVVLKPTYDMTRPHPEMDPNAPAASKKQETGNGKKQQEDEKHIKGNIDADLVLWVMKEINNYEKAIIVSGDGDFYSLIEHLEKQDKLLHILTPNQYYSNLFNAFESYVVSLDKMRDKLEYKDYRRRKRSKNQPKKQPDKSSGGQGKRS